MLVKKNCFLCLIIVSAFYLLVGSSRADARCSPFDENCDVCVTHECDANGQCRKIDSPLPCKKGYRIYVNGVSQTTKEMESFTLEQAQANCRINIEKYPQVIIQCFYDGVLIGETHRRPKSEIIEEINSISRNVGWAENEIKYPGYTQQQKELLQRQINFWKERVKQLFIELTR